MPSNDIIPFSSFLILEVPLRGWDGCVCVLGGGEGRVLTPRKQACSLYAIKLDAG